MAFAKFCWHENLSYSGTSKRVSQKLSSISSMSTSTSEVEAQDSTSASPTEEATSIASIEETFCCPAVGCNKTYLSRASMYQHKRKKHPELVKSRSSSAEGAAAMATRGFLLPCLPKDASSASRSSSSQSSTSDPETSITDNENLNDNSPTAPSMVLDDSLGKTMVLAAAGSSKAPSSPGEGHEGAPSKKKARIDCFDSICF